MLLTPSITPCESSPSFLLCWHKYQTLHRGIHTSVPSWQPLPHWQECIYSLAPLCQEWMSKRGLWKQLFREWSKERGRLLLLLPLCSPSTPLSYSPRPLCERAASQGNAEMRWYAYWSDNIFVSFPTSKLLQQNHKQCIPRDTHVKYNISKYVIHLSTPSQFILTLQPFVTISFSSYQWRVNM